MVRWDGWKVVAISHLLGWQRLFEFEEHHGDQKQPQQASRGGVRQSEGGGDQMPSHQHTHGVRCTGGGGDQP